MDDWNISPLSNNASLQICSYLMVRNIINWINWEWRTSTADATRKNKLYQAWARYHWQWNWPTVALISETTHYFGEYFLPYSLAPKKDGGYKLILNLKNLRVDVRKTQTKVKVSSKSWKIDFAHTFKLENVMSVGNHGVVRSVKYCSIMEKNRKLMNAAENVDKTGDF